MIHATFDANVVGIQPIVEGRSNSGFFRRDAVVCALNISRNLDSSDSFANAVLRIGVYFMTHGGGLSM